MWLGRKKWNTKESKGELWLNHDASIAAAVVGEKAPLRMKRC